MRTCAQLKRVVNELRSRNCFVTVYPIGTELSDTKPELPADVEVLAGGTLDTLPRFLAERHDYYDCILASDSEILAALKPSDVQRRAA